MNGRKKNIKTKYNWYKKKKSTFLESLSQKIHDFSSIPNNSSAEALFEEAKLQIIQAKEREEDLAKRKWRFTGDKIGTSFAIHQQCSYSYRSFLYNLSLQSCALRSQWRSLLFIPGKILWTIGEKPAKRNPISKQLRTQINRAFEATYKKRDTLP